MTHPQRPPPGIARGPREEAGLAVAAAFAVFRPLRWRFWCVVSQHRVRTGFVQAWLHARAGRIPMILWTRPVQEGEQLLVLLRPGLSAADLTAAAPVLAAACWGRSGSNRTRPGLRWPGWSWSATTSRRIRPGRRRSVR